MTTRNFTWADLPGLSHLANLIHQAGGEPYTLPQEWMREELGQPGLCPESNCTVVDGVQGSVAFGVVHPELPIGRVVLEVGIHPDRAEQELEDLMLQAGLDRARQLSAGHLHICVHGSRFWDRLLQDNGFSKVRTYLVMKWQRDELERAEAPQGFTLRSLRPGEESRLAEAQNDAFGGSWGFCPNTTEEVAYRVALQRSGHDGVFLLEDGDAVAGYCWTQILGTSDSSVGVIGMIGVVPAYRGKGLSKPLLLRAMRYMRGRGVKYIKLDVDQQNTPAVSLYTSVGFRQELELYWFEAPLSAA